MKDIYFKERIISLCNVSYHLMGLHCIVIYRVLTEDLKNRLLDWDAQNSCLGDIFVKFCTHLKVYTNFVNNNEVILRCIERSKEQTPSFRAFLKRNDRTPETKMLT